MKTCKLFIFIAFLSGCTLEPGDPWGEVVWEVDAATEAGARSDDAGRWRTSKGYVVEVTRLSVEVQSVGLSLRPEGAEVGFDPASPPAGYSLCHNGHCHRDDGALVDYEDIAVELAGAAGSAGGVTQAVEAEVALGEEPAALPLGPCSDDCQLSPGSLNLATARLGAVTIEGRAYDTRAGERARLPAEGAPFLVRVEQGEGPTPQAAVAGRVGKGEPYGLRLRGSLRVGEALFDGVEWSEPEGVEEALRVGLGEALSFEVDVERFE
jgi:hypothetical protein